MKPKRPLPPRAKARLRSSKRQAQNSDDPKSLSRVQRIRKEDDKDERRPLANEAETVSIDTRSKRPVPPKPKARLRLPKRKAQDLDDPDPESLPRVQRIRQEHDKDETRPGANEAETVEVVDRRKTKKKPVTADVAVDVEEERTDEQEDNVETTDSITTEKRLNALTNSSCNISHVSLLYISLNQEDLVAMCRELEKCLKERASTLIEHHNQAKFTVKAFLLPGVKISKHDSESLIIQVFRETTRDDDEEIELKLLFSALFTSCNSTGGSLKFNLDDPDSPKNLPVFLWYGKTRTWDLIRSIFEDNFQCNFHSVHFSSVHMQIFAGLWLYDDVNRGYSTGRKSNGGVSIDYEFPAYRKSGQKKESENLVLNTELKFDKLMKKLEGVENVLHDNLRLKQVLMKIWQEALDSHVSTTKIDLARATFLKVRTTSCVISSKGRIKLRKGTKLDEFQSFFSQLTRIVELR